MCDEQGGAITFEVGIGGEDDFADGTGIDTRGECIESELFGPHALEWGEAAEQDVVNALIGAGGFEREEVAWLLDDADERGVAARVAADRAEGLFGFGEMEAGLAVSDTLLGLTNGLGQLEGFVFRAFEDVMGESFGGFRADAGESAEGGDEPINDAGHGPRGWRRHGEAGS